MRRSDVSCAIGHNVEKTHFVRDCTYITDVYNKPTYLQMNLFYILKKKIFVQVLLD